MSENRLGLFHGRDRPDAETAWKFYEKGLDFNTQIKLEETVKVNENFYVGKQWEGVESNGLPTPQENFIKRVVGFTTATCTSDNINVNASPLAASPDAEEMIEPVRIVNNEFVALTERNSIPAMIRVYARNAAVDGDGCTYTYWDSNSKNHSGRKGDIKTEIIENSRVFFGNPNDREVQSQPFIQIVMREETRTVKRRAKANGSAGWEEITSDEDESYKMDEAKRTDDKTTVLLTLWRDEGSGEIWAFESTRHQTVREPWSLGIKLYPVTWINWDYIQDSYHGQAMVTGLIPNQIAVNKMWAMSVVSLMKTAFPKIVYNSTLIKRWDNRVGAAIGIPGGDINNVARSVDPAPISPQVSQMITQLVKETEESLGATGTAMGEGRADNTSAIIALQRAAATPNELTKQNLYKSVEDLYRIYLEFMAEYYGWRTVLIDPPQEWVEAAELSGQHLPDKIPTEFDFSMLKEHPMTIKLDVGASSYYSEIAAIQTLDNLLQMGHINILQYLERIPDGYVPGRRALMAEIRKQMAAQAAQVPAGPPGGGGPTEGTEAPEVPFGGGYGALQRAINATGDTQGMI